MKHKSLIVELAEVIARHWPGRDHVLRQLARALVPHPGTLIVTLVVIGGLLWANSVGALPLRAPAAAGTSTGTIAYQGRLADADGNPLTDTYLMIFRLYDVPTGGIFLWEEQWIGSNEVEVSDGLFNVMLGSLKQIPMGVVTDHDTLYLGITVDGDDEMEPRVQLGSVPFAVQALTVPDGSVTTQKIADEAVTSAKLEHSGPHIPITPDENGLVKMAVMRQDHTTNAYSNNQVILTGYGFIGGTGGTFLGESVSFGITFATAPIVTITSAGASGAGTAYAGTADNGATSAKVYNVSTSGFDMRMWRVGVGGYDLKHTFDAGINFFYTWIAIGTLE